MSNLELHNLTDYDLIAAIETAETAGNETRALTLITELLIRRSHEVFMERFDNIDVELPTIDFTIDNPLYNHIR